MQRKLILLLLSIAACSADDSFVRKMAEKQFKASDPKSYAVYKSTLEDTAAQIKHDRRKRVKIFYLTSSTVPPEHFISIVNEAGNTGVDVEVQPIIRGLGNNLEGQVGGYKNAMSKLPPSQSMRVDDIGRSMRVNSSLFKELNVQKVPVIAVAICNSGEPNLKACELKVVGRGATTLGAMAVRSGLGDSAEELLRGVNEIK